MLRGRAWFSVGALIALSTGCSLVVSTSGLTGGADTPTSEGGVEGAFVSSPRSLLATVQGSDTNRSSCLNTALNATPAALEVRFKARIDESAPAQGIEVLNVLFAKPQGSCNVIYSARDGEWTFDEYCSVSGTTTLVDIHRTGVKVVAGAWVSITSKVDLTSKKASVSLDGALPLDVTLGQGLTTGPATLTVGINYVEQGPARSRVHVNDVLVDVK